MQEIGSIVADDPALRVVFVKYIFKSQANCRGLPVSLIEDDVIRSQCWPNYLPKDIPEKDVESAFNSWMSKIYEGKSCNDRAAHNVEEVRTFDEKPEDFGVEDDESSAYSSADSESICEIPIDHEGKRDSCSGEHKSSQT